MGFKRIDNKVVVINTNNIQMIIKTNHSELTSYDFEYEAMDSSRGGCIVKVTSLQGWGSELFAFDRFTMEILATSPHTLEDLIENRLRSFCGDECINLTEKIV
jgi:hypothetical protein